MQRIVWRFSSRQDLETLRSTGSIVSHGKGLMHFHSKQFDPFDKHFILLICFVKDFRVSVLPSKESRGNLRKFAVVRSQILKSSLRRRFSAKQDEFWVCDNPDSGQERCRGQAN